jgi:D-alanyl-D-alanine carboxypeptidase (penicillin-binding protein 5/6)
MVLVFTSFSPFLEAKAASDEESGVNLAEGATSAILIEQDTGTIMFEESPHDKLPPASMTKIMTLLLIMEELDKGNLTLDEKVRVSENASSMGGSQVFLEAGEEMTVDDLLKSIAIASANDASVALAERISGSEEAFVKAMNDKAEEMGLENTQFKNTTGLPSEGHYSSAYDLSLMAQELLKHEEITEYTSIYEDYLRKGTDQEFWLVNTNKLVRFYPEVDGLKTGYTREAKYGLAATAKRDNMRVIAVVLGFETSKDRNAAVSSMLDYAFNTYETEKIHDQGDLITDLMTLKGERKKTNVVTKEPISLLRTKGESVEEWTTEYELDEEFTLPIKQGDVIGRLYIKEGDQIIADSPLTVEDSIEVASFLTLLKRSLGELTAFE